ncbi:MAG: protein-L-isoaspartate(D-aspartate) O-methyltransferase [Planctomycetaceae bacterium]
MPVRASFSSDRPALFHRRLAQRRLARNAWPLIAVVAFSLLALNGSSTHGQSPAQDLFAKQREQLVRERIESAGVKNPRVLRAMRETPRHEFVSPTLRSQAYYDMALPIGDSQTISSPFIVAWMTEAIDPQPTDKVLEIGTGSGYQAAVLSPLVADVYTIEIVRPLGEKATSVLKNLGYDNVHVRVGDGFLGWPEEAPFDKIIVTCSPESIPQPLVDQLREGGNMIIPVGERYQQTLYLLTKKDGELVRKALQPTLFVPMTGQAEAMRKQQPNAANPEVVNGDFEELKTAAGGDEADPLPIDTVAGWYYGRQVRTVQGDAFEGQRFVRCENQITELSSHLLQGVPLDGREVTTIRLSGAVRTSDVKIGNLPDSLPAIAISLYDEQRRDVGTFVIGPFRGSRDWKTHSRLIRVPPQAREAIVRIGLFGATGTADFDAIQVEAVR